MHQFPISQWPLLQDPPFVAWLVAIAFFLGRPVVQVVNREGNASPGETHLFAALLGLGILQYVPYTLGMLHALTPRNLWVATAALSLYALLESGLLIARLRRTHDSPPARSEPLSLDLKVYGVFVGLGLLISIVLALTPPSDPDALFYHLTAPKRWLQFGDLRYLPSFVHTNGPMGGQMLFTWAMALWSDTSTKLLHLTFGVFALLLMVAMGTRLGSRRVGVLAASTWLLGLNFLGTLGATMLFSVAYVDLNLAAFSLASVLSIIIYFRSRLSRWALLSALFAGLALSIKLTGLFVGGALTVAVAVLGLASGDSLVRVIGRSTVFGAVALLPAAPWFVRSWIQTGSPIYLMLASVFETRDWSPAAGRAFGDFFKYYVWGGGHVSLNWSLGLRKAIRLAALVAVASGGAFAIWRLRKAELRFPMFVFVCVALASVLGTGLYLRYLVPFSGLVLVVLFAAIPERVLTLRSFQVGVAGLLFANLALFVKRADPGLLEAFRAGTGQTSREAFMQRNFGLTNDLWNAVNAKAIPGEQVLLAAGRPSYYITPYTLITEAYYQERLRMDTWDNYMSDVRRDDFAYVIVPLKAERSNLVGPPYPAADHEIPFARRLAAEHGTKMGTFGNDELYRIEPASLAR